MAQVKEYLPPVHYYGRRHPVRVNTGSETLVEQCHQETTNINKIIARYHRSGVLPEHREGRYADVSEVGELMDVRMQMNAALAAYEELPASIKDQFKDAGEFVEYAERQRAAEADQTGRPVHSESSNSDSSDNSGAAGSVQDSGKVAAATSADKA